MAEIVRVRAYCGSRAGFLAVEDVAGHRAASGHGALRLVAFVTDRTGGLAVLDVTDPHPGATVVTVPCMQVHPDGTRTPVRAGELR